MCGENAREFRKMRELVERKLDISGFDYVFIGPISSSSLYTVNEPELGSRFMKNLVPVDFGYPQGREILTPEGTYGAVDCFIRSGNKSGKVFYSEEFVRLEKFENVKAGKTRAFWQVGFEIINEPIREANAFAIRTLAEISEAVGISSKILVSDKRILYSAIGECCPKTREKILVLLDKTKDPSELMKRLRAIKAPESALVLPSIMGARNLEEVGELLSSARRSTIGVRELGKIVEIASARVSKLVRVVPVPIIPKGFDAYNNTVFEMRGPFPEIGALAGGGDYTALGSFFKELGRYVPKMTGAGIGLTRMLETVLRVKDDGRISQEDL